MRDATVRRVILFFCLMLTILVFVAAIAVSNIRRSVAASDWVNHTHAVLIEINAVLSSLHEGDAALRTYLLSGDARDQTAYRQAYSEMLEHLTVAKALTKTEYAQAKRMAELEAEIARRIDFTRNVARARQDRGFEAARGMIAADVASETIGNIKRHVTRMNEDVRELLRVRDRAMFAQAQTTRWTVLTGVASNFILLALVAWFIRNDINNRRKVAAALEDANAQLEVKVQERTRELAETNQSLKAENLERLWGNQALEHQLRYSQLIINSITDLVFVLTKSLNVSRINPAVVHATGFESTEIVTNSLSRFVELIPDGNLARLQQLLKDGRDTQNAAVHLITRSGQKIPFQLSLFPLRDKDKVVGGVITLRPAQPSNTNLPPRST